MSAMLLHHEWVGSIQTASRFGLVVHGALGSGQNFRSFIKRLATACPDQAFALVDLRGHGQSHPAQPPHTLAACAEDLERLAQHIAQAAPRTRLHSVIGHSLGGKVALEFARRSRVAAQQVWALDSNPGVQDPGDAHEIRAVLSAVRSIPEPIASRQQVVNALLSRGLSPGLAQWMTTNLRRDGEVFRWVFDHGVIDALLADYFAVDLWPLLEAATAPSELHLVIADSSDRWTSEMRAKAQAVNRPGKVFVHLLPNAGHWVHVDNPQGLLDIIVPALSRA